jgi:UDP-N-acetyl-D-mannosaminuronic acid dehydrogenase
MINASLDICVSLKSPVSELTQKMSSYTPNGETYGLAFVTDDEGKIIGVVSDSDIRKYLAANGNLPNDITPLVQKNFVSVEFDASITHEDFISKVKTNLGEVFQYSIAPIRYVPVTLKGKLHSIIDLRALKLDSLDSLDEIVVLGLGYVGVTLACYLSSRGKKVTGIDISSSRIANLRSAQLEIYEPGLSEVLESGIGEGTLKFQTSLTGFNGGKGTAYFFICVPTPVDDQGKADLSFVESAATAVGKILKKGDVVFLRSTVPVGTTRAISEMISAQTTLVPGIDFTCSFAPERTVEGKAFEELSELPQIVGGVTPNCQKLGAGFFESLGNTVIPVSSAESAEIAKVASNAFRDYVFAFSNSLAVMSSAWNLDVNEIISASNFGYPRNQIPRPSPGVGGPCLSKDPYLMQDVDARVLPNIFHARKINEEMPVILARKAAKIVREEFNSKAPKALIVGMAFKGNPPTNDLRNSPSSDVLMILVNEGFKVDSWDAVVPETNKLDSDYDLYVVMNNHDANSEFVISNLKKNSNNFICISDPWQLLNKPVISKISTGKFLKYLTLSQEITL